MKNFIKKEVVKKESKLCRVKCDLCEKEIKVLDMYYEVETSHSDWGNDSIESLVIIDVCSEECLCKVFNDYINNNSKTKQINVEKVKFIKEF